VRFIAVQTISFGHFSPQQARSVKNGQDNTMLCNYHRINNDNELTLSPLTTPDQSLPSEK